MAVVSGDTSAIVFTCRVVTLAGSALVNVPVKIWVPIPYGREDEARLLATRFAAALVAA